MDLHKKSYTKKDLRLMAQYLHLLADGALVPPERGAGLCSAKFLMFETARAKPGRVPWTSATAVARVNDLLRVLTEDWPEHSGLAAFPVPAPEPRRAQGVPEEEKRERAFNAFNFRMELWGDDEYGDNRRRYCRWLACMIDRHLDGQPYDPYFMEED